MSDKKVIIIQTLIIFILIIGLIIFKFIPEYKNNLGSSDRYIDINNYEDIVEIKINDKLNFSLILSQNKVTNILFFDKTSLCLYNQDIENKDIDIAISKVVNILIENDYLDNLSTINTIKYHGNHYEQVVLRIKEVLQTKNILPNYIETTSTIQEKARSFSITSTDEESILKELEFYSKNLIRNKKYNVSENNQYNNDTPQQEEITEKNAKEYTDLVYLKLEKYIKEQNIVNQDINNPNLKITLIPANINGTIYPDNTSWYYVKESKLYAYISITQKENSNSYCYQGTIDNYKKGQC